MAGSSDPPRPLFRRQRPGRLAGVTIALLVSAAAALAHAQSAPGPEPAQYTPVIPSVFSAPHWFHGADNRFHLVYELTLLNAYPAPVEVVAVEVRDADHDRTVATLRGDELTAAMSLLASSNAPTTTLPAATMGVVWFDLPFADREQLPATIDHRVTVGLPPDLPGPATISASGGAARVDARPPIVLGPPLQGPGWLALGSCCDGPHRRTITSLDGHLYLAQRFAIDFNGLDAQGRVGAGDLSILTNWAGYGQRLLAVADAMVVAAVDRFPDQSEGEHYPITLENLAGNYVILDLGEGRFASYLHIRPGTIAVRSGERVRRGQPIGELGNSGQSEGPHLHFHVQDGPSAFAADGLPYVFDAFDLAGHATPLEELAAQYLAGLPLPIDTRGAGPRQDALPLGDDVVTFPGQAGGS